MDTATATAEIDHGHDPMRQYRHLQQQVGDVAVPVDGMSALRRLISTYLLYKTRQGGADVLPTDLDIPFTSVSSFVLL